MFKLQKVDGCPHARGSAGIVLMTPDLLARIKGAVDGESKEWAMILQGQVEEDGFRIIVDGYRVPKDQERSQANVTLPVGEDGGFDIEDNDVGVIHSHHSMGAFFSTTDIQDLNPKFRMSIVVARAKSLRYVGFDYKGTGKVALPCGAQGEVDFYIQPTEGPEQAVVVRGVDKDPEKLGDCCYKEQISPDPWHLQNSTKCGLGGPVQLLANAFGATPELLAEVQAIAPKTFEASGIGFKNKTGTSVQTKLNGHPEHCKCSQCPHASDCICYACREKLRDSWKTCPHTNLWKKDCKCGKCFVGKETGDTGRNVRNFQGGRHHYTAKEGWVALDQTSEEDGKKGKKGGKKKGKAGHQAEYRAKNASTGGIFKLDKFCEFCFDFVDLGQDNECDQCESKYCFMCEACHEEPTRTCPGLVEVKTIRKRAIRAREEFREKTASILMPSATTDEENPEKTSLPEGMKMLGDGSIVIDMEAYEEAEEDWLDAWARGMGMTKTM